MATTFLVGWEWAGRGSGISRGSFSPVQGLMLQGHVEPFACPTAESYSSWLCFSLALMQFCSYPIVP